MLLVSLTCNLKYVASAVFLCIQSLAKTFNEKKVHMVYSNLSDVILLVLLDATLVLSHISLFNSVSTLSCDLNKRRISRVVLWQIQIFYILQYGILSCRSAVLLPAPR